MKCTLHALDNGTNCPCMWRNAWWKNATQKSRAHLPSFFCLHYTSLFSCWGKYSRKNVFPSSVYETLYHKWNKILRFSLPDSSLKIYNKLKMIKGTKANPTLLQLDLEKRHYQRNEALLSTFKHFIHLYLDGRSLLPNSITKTQQRPLPNGSANLKKTGKKAERKRLPRTSQKKSWEFWNLRQYLSANVHGTASDVDIVYTAHGMAWYRV